VRRWWLLAVAGCGRLSFGPVAGGDGSGGDALQPGACNAITRFADDFGDGGDLAGMWNGKYADPGTSYAEIGGELVLTLAPNSAPAYVGYQTQRYYDLRGHRVTTEVTQLGNAGTDTVFGLRHHAATYLSLGVENGMITAGQTIDGTMTVLARTTYDPAQRFWAFEEQAGQVRALLSSDGVTYTTFYEGPAPFDVSMVAAMLFAGTFTATASPGSAHFASYNGGVAVPGDACPIATLVDTFDGTTGHLWEPSYTDACCTRMVSGGVLAMGTNGTVGYTGNVSSGGYDLREGSIIASLASGPAAGSAFYTYLRAHLDSNNEVGLEFGATTITVYTRIAGTSSYAPRPSNGARYARLRESGGMLYIDASPDRSTWTNVKQLADPFPLDDVVVGLDAGLDAAGAADAVSWDDIGLP
jgi:hypothetical protein